MLTFICRRPSRSAPADKPEAQCVEDSLACTKPWRPEGQEFKTNLDYAHNALEASLDYTSNPA